MSCQLPDETSRPDQFKMMGKIDILLVPIAGGYYTGV